MNYVASDVEALQENAVSCTILWFVAMASEPNVSFGRKVF